MDSNKEILFKNWANYWLINFKKPILSNNTFILQNRLLNVRIIPYFGDKNITKITTNDIQIFLNTVKNKSKLKYDNGSAGKPLGTWSKKKLRFLLLSCFEHAVRENIITFNPVDGTKTAKLYKKIGVGNSY